MSAQNNNYHCARGLIKLMLQRHNCSVGKKYYSTNIPKMCTTSVPAFQIPMKCIIMALLMMGIFLKAAWVVFAGNAGRIPCKNGLHFFSCYEPVLLLPKSIKSLEFKEIDKYLSGNLCYSDKYQK